jgi:integrase
VEERKAQRTAARIEKAKVLTFRQCAEAVIQSKSAGWKSSKRRASDDQWSRSLELYAYPILGKMPIAAVDTAFVMQAIEPIWSVIPATAGRVRGRIEAVLDWAKARGLRNGENPARWKGHLEALLPTVTKVAVQRRAAAGRGEHHAALPYSQVPAFMIELQAVTGGVARALEFTILTVARTSEVLEAEWPESDLAGRVWTIPAIRMKAGKAHRVPLTDAAIALVRGREGLIRPFPFQVTAMLNLLRRRMKRADCTPHGFRSAFAGWCTEMTTFPAEARKIALAHAVGDAVEQAYMRADLFKMRRQLAEAWAAYCTSVAEL